MSGLDPEPSASAATPRAHVTPRGTALFGALWQGGDEAVIADGVVVVDPAGVVAAYGPRQQVDVPPDITVVRGAWVGPGVVDAHVHLAFGATEQMFAGGVLVMRDLGAPLDDALGWRQPDGAPSVTVAGPVLTAPGGYPSRSWGARGFARFLGSAMEARRAVAALDRSGIDVVKIALEPADGLPVPSAEIVRGAVEAAHEVGLPVTCHALTAEMVDRALEAGVDELAHMPVERLPTHLVARLALDEIPVVSTLHTLTANGDVAAEGVLGNARSLVGAGVPLVYGTDLGNAATSTGVDQLELRLLADAGLEPAGALRCATGPGGVSRSGRDAGRVTVGATARLVVLPGDPLDDPVHWERVVAVLAGTRLVRGGRGANT